MGVNCIEDYRFPGKVLAAERSEQGVVFTAENGFIRVNILASDLINVRYMLSLQEKVKDTPAIVKKRWPATDFSLEASADKFIISTEKLQIFINKAFWQMSVYDRQGEEISGDYQQWGLCKMKERVRAVKKLAGGENFYGLGERTGYLNKRGEEHELWNYDQFLPHVPGTKHMYKSIPFLIGLKNRKAYGIFFDNSFKTRFNLGAESEKYFYFEADGGPLNYYFIYGPEMRRVVERYTELTGRMELPPLWALGYQQCRYSYYPQERVEEIAETFRKKEIPCDVIYLDIHYMDGYRVFTWDRERFPEPEEMIRQLQKKGFKVVTIIDPGVKQDRDYQIYRELLARDFACKLPDGKPFVGKVWPGDSVFPDFSREDVRNWWSEKNKEWLETYRLDGLWNDMNEPAVMDREDKTMPPEVIHKNDGSPMEHKEFHNLFGMMMNKATRLGMDKLWPERRKFILTRAAFAGIQRYAAAWTGDNRSYWEHLAMSIPMLQNLSLSGVPFCGADIGGFAENASPELFARWMQVGVFYPLARAHSAVDTRDHEPWSFGKEVEDICRKYIKLRYRLLPFLYNLFKKAELIGEPVFQPLVYRYQDDPAVYDLTDQFLVGEELLAAPVLYPGKRSRSVYLPRGRWYDYYNCKEYQGGRWILADAPLDTMPLFVKAGSIIPHYSLQNYVGEDNQPGLTFRVYPCKGKSTSTYYEDDGETYEYKNGAYNLYQLVQHNTGHSLKIEIRPVHLGFNSGRKEVNMEVLTSMSGPVKVKVDDLEKESGISKNILKFSVPLKDETEKIEIKYQ